MSNIIFKIDGLSELNIALQRLPGETQNKYLQRSTDEGMKEAFPAIQRAAPKHETDQQSEASHKYGSILANLAVQKQTSVRKGQKGTVITTGNAFWSWFYEFGTRHQAANPWFRPAFSASVTRVIDKLSSVLGLGIEDEFGRMTKK